MKIIKNIAILLMLAAYILPASGVAFFMHHCSSMATVELSLQGNNSCCAAPTAQSCVFQDNAVSSHNDVNSTRQTVINKQSCCEDSRLFLKIESDYLASLFKVLQPDISIIDRIGDTDLSPVLYSEKLLRESPSSPDPPGLEILLVTSSLRL
ncbi:MAG: hypothetical protein K0B15_03760 [Lentimicrobium sp.]|nr:hypothetical protein [Lentimicrobium sp.]